MMNTSKRINLGTANGWKVNPPEYDAHVNNCGKPNKDYPQYRDYNITEVKLGNCYYEYHCNDCGIVWRVDSSD